MRRRSARTDNTRVLGFQPHLHVGGLEKEEGDAEATRKEPCLMLHMVQFACTLQKAQADVAPRRGWARLYGNARPILPSLSQARRLAGTMAGERQEDSLFGQTTLHAQAAMRPSSVSV